MNKKEVKMIIMSMRNSENEAAINYLLGEIDIREESNIEQATAKLENSEENIRKFFAKELEKIKWNRNNEKFPINDMFTYGLSR